MEKDSVTDELDGRQLEALKELRDDKLEDGKGLLPGVGPSPWKFWRQLVELGVAEYCGSYVKITDEGLVRLREYESFG